MLTLTDADHRLVDLTRTIVPDEQPADRPFQLTRGFLADNSFKHDIRTHSHVGTHIEFPAHFFEGGKDGLAYDVGTFARSAALFELDLPPGLDVYFTGDMLEKDVGSFVQPGWMLLVRNNNKESVEAGKADHYLLPKFSRDACEWIRDRGIVVLGVDERTVWFGDSIEETRRFHDILMGADICVIETLDNLDALRCKTFFLLALPVKVAGLDSAWSRVVAVEDRTES